jgi:thioredoxin
MERDHEFTIEIPDDGAWAVKLLEGVEIERSDGVACGHWRAFDLEAQGDTEAEVYQTLLTAVVQQIGQPGSPEYQPFARYVREHGARLSVDEMAARQFARLRDMPIRWHVTDDEQYMVALWRDAELQSGDGTVILRAFGLEASGSDVNRATRALGTALSEACGESDEPGPRFDEITGWVRSHGEPVSAEVLAKEAEEKRTYLVARDKLTAITPDDIPAESSTGVPLLVDFWADWCRPCRMVTPVLAGLAEQWAGRIVIRKVDVDRFEGVWERFNFRGIPAMLLFEDGEEIHRVMGFGGTAALIAELEPHLA